jgi:hypothetical protein
LLAALLVAAPVSIWAQPSLTNGLAAYYPFDGSAKDRSGNGRNGAVYGATLTADRFGLAEQAYSFNGNNWIELPDEILPPVAAELTISAWVLAGPGPYSAQQQLLDLTTRRGESGFAIIPGTPVSWTFGVHLQNSGWQNIQAPLTPGAWTQLVGAYKQGEAMQFWVNGVLIQSNTMPNDTLFVLPGYALNSAIGIYDYAPSPYDGFNGMMDDVRIYSRALSVAEVQQLYRLESAPAPVVSLIKAVKPAFTYLSVGTNYQLQVSSDLVTWTNQGSLFTATNPVMTYPQYWDVEDWQRLFFRLRVWQ